MTAIEDRKPELFCPQSECFKISTDDLYTDQQIKTVEQMRIDQTYNFQARFKRFLGTFSPDQAKHFWKKFTESKDHELWKRRQNYRIQEEIRKLFADPLVQNHDVYDLFETSIIFDALAERDILREDDPNVCF